MLEREARLTGSKVGFQTECINNLKGFLKNVLFKTSESVKQEA